jgi:hypothetical protein
MYFLEARLLAADNGTHRSIAQLPGYGGGVPHPVVNLH